LEADIIKDTQTNSIPSKKVKEVSLLFYDYFIK